MLELGFEYQGKKNYKGIFFAVKGFCFSFCFFLLLSFSCGISKGLTN